MRDEQPEKEETIGFTHETFLVVFFTKVWSLGDFPGGPMVKTSNAGSVGSIPGHGAKIPYALQLVSLHTTTGEPTCDN